MTQYHETFIRVVRACEYYEGAKGLVLEVVEWDRAYGISSECKPLGDFQIGADRWSRGTPAFFNVKNAIRYAKNEFFDCEVRVALGD